MRRTATSIGEPPIVEVDTIWNATRASPERDDTTDAPPPVETSGVVCETDEETGVERSEPTDPVNERREIVAEIKLFHLDGEFDSYGGWHDNRHKKGSYQCILGTNSLIRALYSWTGGAPPSRIHQEPLDPEHTDILVFGMMSKPVASFFRDRLGIGNDNTSPSMQIGKPFRPLIRNLQPVKDQLAKLEEKYR